MVIEARRRCVLGTAVRKVGAAMAILVTLLAVSLLCSTIALAASPPTFDLTNYDACLSPS